MTDLVALKAANAKRWANAKAVRRDEFVAVAKRLIAPVAKSRYQGVSAKTGVPWFFIAVAHERESSQNWAGSLAQGDPWNKVSVHVPAGRGPFPNWEAAAVDALVSCAPYAARNKDWSTGGLLTMLEQYNGLGYAAHGRPSPYVWAGTDQYVSGKYIRDGVYDPNAVDKQLGCAGLIMAMMALDSSIKIGGAITILPPGPTPPDVPKPAPQVTPAKSAKGGAAAIVIGAGGTAATVAYHGYSLLEIGLSAFIAAGLVTAVVVLVRKFK